MARKGIGRTGASTNMISISAPNLGLGKLSFSEKKVFLAIRAHSKRMKEDPEYAEKTKLKMQLRATSSTKTSYAKKNKANITLPKFSWDK